MRKFLSIFAIAAMCGLAFTACSDDETTPSPTPGPPAPVTVTKGVFLLNSGNMSAAINGSLSYYNADGSVVSNAFSSINGRSLGLTPNDIIIHGSKIYIAVTDEHTVEVVDKNTLKSIKQIKTTELMGTDKGTQPRHLLAAGKYVFISTFAGYVAAVDTTDFTAANIYQAGSYPEGMAVSGNTLYVANSDYSLLTNPSISIINLNTGEKVSDIKDDLILNPQSITEINGKLYFLDWGKYAPNQIDAGIREVKDGVITKVADATMMAANPENGLIYIVNAPYSYPATPATYSVYNTETGEETKFIDGDDIEYPAAIAVDPVTGSVFIASMHLDPDYGFADYFNNGYVRVYNAEGTFVTEYEAGVGPVAFAFNHNNLNIVNE